MIIDKKSRDVLKSRFKKNAIPTEGDFADLIDAAVNQKEDGLAKPPNEPLSVEALPGGNRPVLRLYERFDDAAPAWTFSLQGGDTSGASKALVVSDGDGRAWLSVDRETGALGASGVINASGGVKIPAEKALESAGVVTAELRVTGSRTWLAGVDTSGSHWLAAGQPEGINLPGQAPTALGFHPEGKRLVVGPGWSLGGSGGPLKVGGDLAVESSLQVGGNATLKGDTLAKGDVAVGGDLELGGAFTTPGVVSLQTPRPGIRLDGDVPQYIELPDLPEKFFVEADLTIQAWVYLYPTQGEAVIVSLSGDKKERVRLSLEKGVLRLVAQVGEKAFVIAGKLLHGDVVTRRWAHLAGVVVAGKPVALFKNGALMEKEASPLSELPPALPVKNCLGYGVNGVLAEASLWRSAEKVVTMAPLRGDEPGLVGYWKLNSAVSGVAKDACTNSYHVGDAKLPAGAGVVAAGSLADIKQEGWASPVMQNGWVAYGSGYNVPGYFKDSCGIVRLRGLVKSGAIGTVIFALPAGYRPEARELFIACSSPGVAGRVDVRPDGQVIAVGGSPDWLSLDGLSFRAYR